MGAGETREVLGGGGSLMSTSLAHIAYCFGDGPIQGSVCGMVWVSCRQIRCEKKRHSRVVIFVSRVPILEYVHHTLNIGPTREGICKHRVVNVGTAGEITAAFRRHVKSVSPYPFSLHWYREGKLAM